MLLIIQCIILCIVFTLGVVPKLYKNPLNCIMSYPKEIRERVENLPEYKNKIKKYKTKHMKSKLISILVLIIIMSIIAWISGAKTFTEAFVHVFILFMAINLYDLLILDILVFCHSKKVIILGTEDMVKQYRSPNHHIKSSIIGTIIGLIIALSAGGLIILFNFYL
ncbi:hypothetical protein [Clostridium sp. LP20]|uniref:hypothetical protein n=1 Tax=Clostridium sp. LP20 TaxID=3418665 RepID=UPI003EE58E9D